MRPYIWRLTSFSLVIWAFGRAIGPRQGDRGAHGGLVLDDAVGERCDQARLCAFQPRVEMGRRSRADHRMEGESDRRRQVSPDWVRHHPLSTNRRDLQVRSSRLIARAFRRR
jgi:hypothetical protein